MVCEHSLSLPRGIQSPKNTFVHWNTLKLREVTKWLIHQQLSKLSLTRRSLAIQRFRTPTSQQPQQQQWSGAAIYPRQTGPPLPATIQTKNPEKQSETLSSGLAALTTPHRLFSHTATLVSAPQQFRKCKTLTHQQLWSSSFSQPSWLNYTESNTKLIMHSPFVNSVNV